MTDNTINRDKMLDNLLDFQQPEEYQRSIFFTATNLIGVELPEKQRECIVDTLTVLYESFEMLRSEDQTALTTEEALKKATEISEKILEEQKAKTK